MSLTVTINPKPTKTHKKVKRKEPSKNTEENQQIKRKGIKRRKEHRRTTKQLKNKTMAVSIYLSIITLNVNGLNAPMKR